MQPLPMESLIHTEGGAVANELRQRFNYALINPLIVQMRDWQDLPVVALETSPAPARAHRLPQLVDLGSISGNTYGDLTNRMRRYDKRGLSFFSALLQSKASVETVATHLKRQLLQRRRQGRQPHWFRYYDPLVFRHLVWLLTPRQLTRLMGPVTHWSWQDRPGHWQTLERPEEAARISWLELNRNQWLSIDRFAALNRSLRRLQAIAPDWPQDMVHWRWLDDTMRYLDETFGLPAEDQQFVAESAARYHPDLVMHPDIESQLNQAALAPPGAADRLRQFNNTAWNTIISDLKERT